MMCAAAGLRLWLALVVASLLRQSHADDGEVSSARWRLVGRGVSSDWKVSRIKFRALDASWVEQQAGSMPGATPCGELISSVPWARGAGGQLADGSAFAGPTLVAPEGGRMPNVAFEDTDEAWSPGVPCLAADDTCFLGFRWFGTRASTEAEATGSRLTRYEASPRCLEVEQSATSGEFAPNVLVQYWSDASKSWLTHTEFSGLSGGSITLRLPRVPGR
mmetsp:Transcript_99078/g.284863  ORF Transcript_99078/g.284863 Transcript_99078/m.284863 type:complete len:219 (+) Transcript_99078:101-757(+)